MIDKISLSYWEEKAWFSLSDVTIIGAGIVGLCSAIEIKKKNPKATVRIFEAGTIPAGATTRNAGFACFGSLGELHDDLQNRSMDEVIRLVKLRHDGLKYLRNLIGDEAMNYSPVGNYELFSQADEDYYHKVISIMPEINLALKNMGLSETYSSADSKISEFGFAKTSHLIFNRHEGMLDSALLYKSLLKICCQLEVEIIFNSKILGFEFDGNFVQLLLEKISKPVPTRNLLICNNGFAAQLLPELDVKPARGQVLVTKPIQCKFNAAFHHNKGYNYFRNLDGRILLGGGRNLDFQTETTTELSINNMIQDYLEKLLAEVILPNEKVEIDYRWAGIMGVGDAKNPIIQKLSPHVFCAVRMGGMGVAIGSMCGLQAAELVSAHI